jgi:hypothetical protein
MKTLTTFAFLLFGLIAQAQTFRTLNHFIIDSAGVEHFDSFDYVKVKITVNASKLRLYHVKTAEVKDYAIDSIQSLKTYKIAFLSNCETFYYTDKMNRVYFITADGKRIREYKRL